MTDAAWKLWMEGSGEAVQLQIPEDCRAGVIENLQRNFAIADILNRMDLPDTLEPVAIFAP